MEMKDFLENMLDRDISKFKISKYLSEEKVQKKDDVDLVLEGLDEISVSSSGVKSVESVEETISEDELELDFGDVEPKATVNLFDGYLGEQSSVPNPLEYGPNATYRNLREGIVYKKGPDNLWEVFLQDGKQGRAGQAAPGGGCGVTEVKSIATDIVDSALINFNTQATFKLPTKGNVSWNSYDIFYNHLNSHVWNSVPNSIATSSFDYIKQCGGEIVRLVYPAFTDSQIKNDVFAGSVPNRSYVDSDFKPEFLSASDAWFNYCETNNILQHITLFWDYTYAGYLVGETSANQLLSGFRSIDTPACLYMRRFANWCANRYKDSSSIAMWSIGNEWIPSELASNRPWNKSELKSIIDAISSEIKSANANFKVTADLLFPLGDTQKTRKTLDYYVDYYTSMFDNLDAWTLHAYSKDNYLGMNENYAVNFTPSSANTFGYDSFKNVLSIFKSVAKANNKLFILGELGVSRSMELDSSTLKKDRIIDVCKQYTDYSMLWNLQSNTIASALSNQADWWTFPGDVRADTYRSLLAAYNGLESIPSNLISVGTSSTIIANRPKLGILHNRANTGKISFSSTAAMSVSGDYCLMFWTKVNQSLTAFERFYDLRSSASNAGSIMLSDTSGAGYWYIECKNALSAATGSIVAYVNPFNLSEWNHITYVMKKGTSGTSAHAQLYINGVMWIARTNTTEMGFVPTGSTLYVGGESTTGAPVSFQDFAILKSFTPTDIMKHISGEVLSQSLIHIRALPSGDIMDMSRYNVPLTVGSTVAIETF